MTSQKKSPVGAGLNSNANIPVPNYTRPLDRLLPHLDGVRWTGREKLIAKCPAHEDRSPSLSVKETDDGTLLVKCWAGCTADEIVRAVGLRLADLFPRAERTTTRTPGLPAWKRRKLLEAAEYERLIRRVALADLKAGRVLPEADIQRAELAQQRLQTIEEVLRHA